MMELYLEFPLKEGVVMKKQISVLHYFDLSVERPNERTLGHAFDASMLVRHQSCQNPCVRCSRFPHSKLKKENRLSRTGRIVSSRRSSKPPTYFSSHFHLSLLHQRHPKIPTVGEKKRVSCSFFFLYRSPVIQWSMGRFDSSYGCWLFVDETDTLWFNF